MEIKDKILEAHPNAKSRSYNYETIYIADFTKRTNSKRSVEVSDFQQTCPKTGKLMDSAVFRNPGRVNVEFVQYDDNSFKNLSGYNVKHCEGTIFPAGEAEVKWVIMLELKDCMPQNVLNHAAKARRQIYNVYKDLLQRGILSKEFVYGIYSCPQRHTSFNDLVFGDIIQQTRLKRHTGIIFVGTNFVMLVDKNICKPKMS